MEQVWYTFEIIGKQVRPSGITPNWLCTATQPHYESPPPKFGEEEYDSYFDSDLWDLPSTQLNLLEGESQCGVSVEGAESVLDKIDLTKFDLNLALNQVLARVGYGMHGGVQWRLWKYAEEAEFGPGDPVHTVFITGKLVSVDDNLQGSVRPTLIMFP
ncbi:hypothetical protein CK203_088462 [Vitis vinifera]|uniref:Uncharacterized protein n=1 Tax=Vitis vinifera TaxID=29760 RepID=A0A438ELD6_VITVI|nr:hypothetical protein CK203_088462 [Vitis vinifera]